MEDYIIKITHPTNNNSIYATSGDPTKLVVKRPDLTSEFHISKSELEKSLLTDKFTKEAMNSGFRKKHVNSILNYIFKFVR